MKKHLLWLIAVVVVLLIAPAAVARPSPVGERISLFAGLIEYPADTPFHVGHGWQALEVAGLHDFQLQLDDVWVTPDSRVFGALPREIGPGVSRWVLFNFPDGLPPGRHTFRGVFLAPCELAVEIGYPGPCERPNKQVIYFEATLEVVFFDE